MCSIGKKNLRNLIRKIRKKTRGLIDEKPPKFNEETRKKSRSLINEKLLQLDRETKRKTDHLLLCRG